MSLFGLWFFQRVLVSLMASLYSTIRPLHPVEVSAALWPPSFTMAWVERVFLSPMVRWDASWYIRIISEGYSSTDGTASFHPLLPLLARIPYSLGLDPIFSLLIVNSIAGLVLLRVFYQLAALDLPGDQAQTSVVLLLFSPLAFTLFIPYTEPLYLCWAVLSLYWARRSKWLAAGLAAGLATLTRQQGLFLVIPLTWEVFEANGRNIPSTLRAWRSWLPISLVPIAMGCWLLYRGLALGDLRVDVWHLQEMIYSVLLSPSTTQVVPHFQFLPPWQVISLAMDKLRSGADVDLYTNLCFGAVFLIGAVLAWRRMRLSDQLFSFIIILVALSDYTGPVHPYMGLPRHLWLAFPIFIGLAPLVNRPWKRLAWVFVGSISIQFLLLQYVLESWVP